MSHDPLPRLWPVPARGAASCPGCHLPLTGPDAARLWQVDQSLAALQLERTSLLAALRATGAPRRRTGATAAAAASAAATEAARHRSCAAESLGRACRLRSPARAPPRPPRRSWTTQQTLLAVGVLLVLVAASIALAIAWFVIGRTGQMVVMGGFTAAAVVASLQLSRRHLPSSAEALAAGRRWPAAPRRQCRAPVRPGRPRRPRRTHVCRGHRPARRRRCSPPCTAATGASPASPLLSLTAASIGWAGIVGLRRRPLPRVAALSLARCRAASALAHLVDARPPSA